MAALSLETLIQRDLPHSPEDVAKYLLLQRNRAGLWVSNVLPFWDFATSSTTPFRMIDTTTFEGLLRGVHAISPVPADSIPPTASTATASPGDTDSDSDFVPSVCPGCNRCDPSFTPSTEEGPEFHTVAFSPAPPSSPPPPI
mmetsp:Transcript_540/g.998  ORF Transcript_540/g.998 Transcript_540/m.998 type:complete len:142 (+) Transcript_540:268-693(+)